MSIRSTSSFNALQEYAARMQSVSLKRLFKEEPNRFENSSLSYKGFFYDYSKALMTQDTKALLLGYAKEMKLSEQIRRFKQQGTGSKEPYFNGTERKRVLHTCLRRRGAKGMEGMDEERERMKRFSGMIRSRRYHGATGKAIRNVIHLGVGGSDKGPRLLMDAFGADGSEMGCRVEVRYVSNVDSVDLRRSLSGLNPEETLFIIVSKSFSTRETLLNAQAAKRWVRKGLMDVLGVAARDCEKEKLHFWGVTCSSSKEKAIRFGLRAEHLFLTSEEICGRHSVWSPMSVSAVCGLGDEAFESFLEGGRLADEHFFSAPLERNIPVLMGLIGVWHRNFLRINSHGIFPYSHRLRDLPSYLQQLEMESNGKSIGTDGKVLLHRTSPVIWGDACPSAEHSLFQWLHQSSQVASSDFIVVKQPTCPINTDLNENENHDLYVHHKELLLHCLVQSEALAFGVSEDQVRAFLEKQSTLSPRRREELITLIPYMVCQGNRPSNVFVMESLTPRYLGMLLGFYEHKVLVQGLLWGINSFDQYGIEATKMMIEHDETKESNEGLGHGKSLRDVLF